MRQHQQNLSSRTSAAKRQSQQPFANIRQQLNPETHQNHGLLLQQQENLQLPPLQQNIGLQSAQNAGLSAKNQQNNTLARSRSKRASQQHVSPRRPPVHPQSSVTRASMTSPAPAMLMQTPPAVYSRKAMRVSENSNPSQASATQKFVASGSISHTPQQDQQMTTYTPKSHFFARNQNKGGALQERQVLSEISTTSNNLNSHSNQPNFQDHHHQSLSYSGRRKKSVARCSESPASNLLVGQQAFKQWLGGHQDTTLRSKQPKMMPVLGAEDRSSLLLSGHYQQQPSSYHLAAQSTLTEETKMTHQMRMSSNCCTTAGPQQAPSSSTSLAHGSYLKVKPLIESVGQRVSGSMCFSIVLEYLRPVDTIQLQQLSRFFYSTQMPRCMMRMRVASRSNRLHLLNANYIVTFDCLTWTKSMRKIKNDDFQSMWNQQSIEVRGRIYMTGGAIANTKTYLKQTCVLNEQTFCFEPKADMNYQRDAHGVTKWMNRYIIAVGSWHGTESTKTCEYYDVVTDKWHMLPSLNDGTCAPGLIVMDDRYLFKLGGTSDIGKVEVLDLKAPKHWISINTANKFGRKHTINRCLLYPVPPPQRHFGTQIQQNESTKMLQGPLEPAYDDDGKFLVLGCHFGRSEKPFVYDITKNKYAQFQDKDIFVDMYRSNDVVQYDRSSIHIRPFVKVGERADQIKVYQYFLEDAFERQPQKGKATAACQNNNTSSNSQSTRQSVRRTLAQHARCSAANTDQAKSGDYCQSSQQQILFGGSSLNNQSSSIAASESTAAISQSATNPFSYSRSGVGGAVSGHHNQQGTSSTRASSFVQSTITSTGAGSMPVSRNISALQQHQQVHKPAHNCACSNCRQSAAAAAQSSNIEPASLFSRVANLFSLSRSGSQISSNHAPTGRNNQDNFKATCRSSAKPTSSQPAQSTKRIAKGTLREVSFAVDVWESSDSEDVNNSQDEADVVNVNTGHAAGGQDAADSRQQQNQRREAPQLLRNNQGATQRRQM